jgi:hypothetical protein
LRDKYLGREKKDADAARSKVAARNKIYRSSPRGNPIRGLAEAGESKTLSRGFRFLSGQERISKDNISEGIGRKPILRAAKFNAARNEIYRSSPRVILIRGLAEAGD